MMEMMRKFPADRKEYINFLLKKLKQNNIKAYLYYVAKTGSFYIKMKNKKLGSIRIGDHDGRKKYKYKYNVRFDMLNSFTEIDRNVKRFYCPPKQYKKIIKKIKEEMIFNV